MSKPNLWSPIFLLGVSVLCHGSMTFAQDDSQRKADDTQSNVSVRDSWPRFLGNNFDGVGKPAKDIVWTAQPKFLWSIKVGPGYGLGAIQNGNYYHFDASPDGRTERLTCIDWNTGEVKWRKASPLAYRDLYGYENGPRGSATISEGQIYTMGVGGRLTCRNIDDGEESWSLETNEKYGVVQNFFGVGGAPLIVDDAVIVMVGGSPAEDQRVAPGRLDRVSPNGTALVALNRKDGSELWRSGNDLASYSSPLTMNVEGQTVVLLFARNSLLAIDAKTGKQLWSFGHRAEILESVNAMVPIVDGDHVFISECYAVGSALLKVTRSGAEVVWRDPPRDRRRQAMRVHWSNPALVNGHLYGCSGRNAPDSGFRCVQLRTGRVLWDDDRRARSSVTQAGDHLLVLEERGSMQVIKPNPERLDVVAEWKLQLVDGKRPALEYPCWAAPIILGDRVLVRGDEDVVCLQLKRRSSN